MSSGNSSSYINDDDPNRSVLDSMFSISGKKLNEGVPKPYSERDLPYSFYHPPYQHTKNQRSLPNPSVTKTYSHSRAVSDTAAIAEQTKTTLPLPDGWQEKQNSDGQIFYIDHLTKSTTWIDPRPKHYAAFQAYCATLPLPAGFKERCDLKGNIYFTDHKNEQTYWDDPRLNYYRSLMTKRLDISSQEETLTNELTENLKEQHALQIRAQELQRRADDIRQSLNRRDQTTSDDLLHHRRQDSVDSGLYDGSYTEASALSSADLLDDILSGSFQWN